MYKRPTTLAEAFINAAVNSGDLKRAKVDHQRWVARRVAMNATERGEFGMVTEWDWFSQVTTHKL